MSPIPSEDISLLGSAFFRREALASADNVDKHAASHLHHGRRLVVQPLSMQCRRQYGFTDLFVCLRSIAAYSRA